jgi:transposase
VIDVAAIKSRFEAVAPFLDERGRRVVAASEALTAGRGGVKAVCEATAVARSTIGRGLAELRGGENHLGGRVRRAGGGRKAAIERQAGLLETLAELVQSAIRGDPQAALLWVSKSQRHLAGALAERGFVVSHKLVGRLLRRLGFTLQSNRKTREGASHPDRDAQFEHINTQVSDFQAAGQPAISVDTKKKELVGDFRNSGRELRPKGEPERVRVHDFKIPELGKVAPYGIYDIAANTGWVNVGIDHDTAAFAVESIRRWWHGFGRQRYPAATRLLITADCGGSNGARVRLWKRELQSFANQSGLAITVTHHPPGTSKWNRIEHRLFAFITQNWRGKPLLSHAVIVRLIGATTTTAGLAVHCYLDDNNYPKAIKVSDAEMAQINIKPDHFHGEWNYTISPAQPTV